MSIRVLIDFQDDGRDALPVSLEVVPRVGELVGVRQSAAMLGSADFLLDRVVEVRHYPLDERGNAAHEIRVLTTAVEE